MSYRPTATPSLFPYLSCLHGDGSNTRRYIYGADVADAITCIMHKGSIGETYNIGTKFEISNKELAKYIIQEMGLGGQSDQLLEFVSDRPFNDLRYAVDSAKLEKMGWKAQVPFQEGLEKTSKKVKSLS